ncbi:MAG: hypothetical protein WDW36_007303 [Sanguina aurantia]
MSDAAGLSLSTGLLVTLLVAWSTLGHSLASRCHYVTEGSLACGLGLVAGLLLLSFRGWLSRGLVADLLAFNSASFFTYLLPPVIFYAGLSVEKRLLFANLPSILSLGILGTVISFVVISVSLYLLTASQLHLQDCLALGAIFSATDSVATLQVLSQDTMPLLFSLCFGEGIVNDATSVVLLAAVKHFATPRAPPPPPPSPPQPPPPILDAAARSTSGAIAAGIQGLISLFINETSSLINSTVVGPSSPTTPPPPSPVHVHSRNHPAATDLGFFPPVPGTAVGMAEAAAANATAAAAAEAAAAAAGTNATSTLAPPPFPPTSPETVDTSAAALGHLSYSLLTGFTSMLFFSLSLGCVAGFGIAEVAVVGLLSYLTYLAAEMFGLSSILALFVCGLTVSHVALPTMSATGRATTLTTFNTLSHLSEGIIFIYVGLDSLDPAKWHASYPLELMWLLLVMCGVLLAARACAVIPLTLLHNAWSGQRLRTRDKLVMWWSGLMRGSVSVALVYWYFDSTTSSDSGGSNGNDSVPGGPLSVVDRQHATLIVTTLATVLVSIMVVGALTKPFLHMAMTEQAPLQVVALAPSHALAVVVAAAKIGAARLSLAVTKIRHFAARKQNGGDAGEDGDQIALLSISSSHSQQQCESGGGTAANSLPQQQHTHQTLTQSRLSVLHSNTGATGGRQASAAPPSGSTSAPAQDTQPGGRTPLPQQSSTAPTARGQAASQGGSERSPLPGGTRVLSPQKASEGRPGGASHAEAGDPSSDGDHGRLGGGLGLLKGPSRDSGPGRQRSSRLDKELNEK